LAPAIRAPEKPVHPQRTGKYSEALDSILSSVTWIDRAMGEIA